MSCHACKKAMLQSKIKQFYYPRLEDSLQPTHMIDVLKNHLKSLRCTSRKLRAETGAAFYQIYVKRFLSVVAGFAFTSRQHISLHLPMTASET